MTGPEPSGEKSRLAALASRLPEGRGGFLRWPEEVGSTNTVMKEWAGQGAPAGSVILAERQTGGRGRLGRSFVSPPGGLYLSYLMRPRLSPEGVGGLTAWTAVAVRRALGRCSPEEFPPELRRRAASLRALGLPVPARGDLAAALVRSLDDLAAEFPLAGDAYREEYRACCVTLGKTVTLPDGTEGFAEGLGEDFSLLLRLPDGSLRKLRSGEATLHRE